MHRSLFAPTLSALTLALVLTPLAPAAAVPVEDEAATTQKLSEKAPPEVTDRMIVKYREPVSAGTSEKVVEKAAGEAAVREAGEATEVGSTTDGAAVVELAEVVTTGKAEELAKQVEKDPAVAYAEPDRLVSVAQIAGLSEADREEMERMVSTAAAAYDPGVPYLWALNNLGAPRAWDTATGKGVTIGIVDTGIANHPDLDSKIVGGYDFVSTTNLSNDGNGRDGDPRDPGTHSTQGQCYTGSPASNSIWHGTHVAGTAAAAADNYGTVGIAPDATLLDARALGACGYGYVSDMADAVRWLAGDTVAGAPAAPKRADVINMSLSMGMSCPITLQNAINTAWFRGIPVAVAAGNSGVDALSAAPGNCYNVVTVGAIGSDRVRASYSNYGWAVDIYAPGHHILSSGNTGRTTPAAPNTRYDYGTSMAAPHVAGTLALLKQKNPMLTSDQYKKILLDSGDPFAEGKTLNTHDALYITKAGTVAPASPAAPAPPKAPTSAFSTKGAIGRLYEQIKARTGAPTSNEMPVAGGVYQTFANGAIYWSSPTGAHWVHGGIWNSYRANGTAAGVLAFPRSPEKPNGVGGAYQLFQDGKILWGPQTGGYAVSGPVEQVYAQAGNEHGALGYPTSDQRSNGTGGFYQTFQNGRILTGPKTGTFPIVGQLSTAYSRARSEHGTLGYPVAWERSDGTGGSYQTFQGGTIVRGPSTGAFTVKGAIGSLHGRLGGVGGSLGYPTSEERPDGAGGVYQTFQRGTLVWSPKTGVDLLKGAIGHAYMDLGGPAARLGYPVTGEIVRSDGSVVQYFQGGRITWASGVGVRIVYGS